MCNFHIGQKVVCINEHFIIDPFVVGVPHPKKNDVLTINWVGSDSSGMFLGFKEILEDVCFMSTHFRPLIEDYTEEEIESVNIYELVEPEYEYA